MMGLSSEVMSVIAIGLAIAFVVAAVVYTGRVMVVAGALMVLAGGFSAVTAPGGLAQTSSIILFVGGCLTVGIGLAVIQLQAIRELLTSAIYQQRQGQ